MTPADIMNARLRGEPDPVETEKARAKSGARNAAYARAWIRVFYGDPMTGEAWPEEHDVTGRAYFGRDGETPCMDGSRILTDCVVAILNNPRAGWRYWYRHPEFSVGQWYATDENPPAGFAAQVFHNGALYANCRSMDEAERLRDFMTGVRMQKGGRIAKRKA